MKVILSRKGFDSANGGFPSPIFPDGTMMSLPIPVQGDRVLYSSLHGGRMFEVMRGLCPRIVARGEKVDLTPRTECHLDPDIGRDAEERDPGWRGLFGQIGAAQRHLANQGVGEGDLFLFFGWFRRVEKHRDKWRYVRGAPDLHVIFGYLQVEEVHRPNTDSPRWMWYHPHVAIEDRREDESNMVYVARRTLTWDRELPGYGTFGFRDELVLTRPGLSRSRWKLPEFFKNLSISYHDPNSWREGYFQSAAIGQEFVIEESPEVEKWAMDIVGVLKN